MKSRRFEITAKEFDENGNVIREETGVSFELTPDEGKAFRDKRNGEVIIRQDNGKGAIIEIPAEFLEFYEEISL